MNLQPAQRRVDAFRFSTLSALSLLIFAGCQGNVDPAPDPVEPLANPVRESARAVEELSDEEQARLRAKSVDSLLAYTRRRFGRFENWRVLHHLEACLDRPQSPTVDVYLELGLQYLTVGRFDSAIKVLEAARRGAPQSKLKPYVEQVLAEAKKVKATLTKSRDALRAEGVDVKYPDERIFAAAFAEAPEKDYFLLLNIADAYVADHPDSTTALMTLAEMNLSFIEHQPADSAVPEIRAEACIYRGQSALEEFKKQKPQAIYPAYRLMHHVLRTIEPAPGRRAVRRDVLPPLVIDVLRDLKTNPALTDAQKAFFLYGESMFYLAGPSWENRLSAEIIAWLKEAVRLDPDAQQYRRLLASVQKNAKKIDDAKQRARSREDAASAKFARDLLGHPNGKFYVGTGGEQLYYGLMSVLWNGAIDELRREEDGEFAVRLMERIGCPHCLGHGENLWGGGACPTCSGDGKL